MTHKEELLTLLKKIGFDVHESTNDFNTQELRVDSASGAASLVFSFSQSGVFQDVVSDGIEELHIYDCIYK